MDTRLQIRLGRVSRRLSSLKLGWSLAVVWLLAAGIGWLLLVAKRNGFPGLQNAHWWWLGFTTCTAVVAWSLIRWKQRDLRSVAGRLERSFPSLNQTLLTASGIQTADGSLGFLQRSVISEAIRHDVTYHWKSVVSGARIALGWLANIPALVILALIGTALFKTPYQPQPMANTLLSSTKPLAAPLVQPGNTEIERGSSLIVTAGFNGRVPDEVRLLKTPQIASSEPSAENAQLEMLRTLNDPVFAVHVYDVQLPFEYVVAFDGQVTETYRIEVFEYPALVRADAKLRFPSYVGTEDKVVVDTRRVTAAAGTELTWQLHLNKPVVEAQLIPSTANVREEAEQAVEDALVLAPSSEMENVYEATIQLTENETWKLRLVDEAGRENSIDVTLRAKVLPNRESKIRLAQGGDQLVSPLQEFEIAADISDDFGIQAAGIGYQFAGGDLVEIENKSIEKGARKVSIRELIDFESLAAEPAQLLSYYVWADDEDQEGRRRVVGDMFFVEVRPFEEVFREGEQPNGDQQQQQQQQGPQGNQETEELLELQKQIVVATWNILRKSRGEVIAEEVIEDLSLLTESQTTAISLLEEKAGQSSVGGMQEIISSAQQNMNQAADSLAEAVGDRSKETLKQALTSEQSAYQDLLRLQGREFEVARSQSSSSSQSRSRQSQARQQQIDQLRLQNEENRYQQERLAQDQQDQEQSELRQVLSRLRELAARQEDLNEQLRELEAALQAAETEEERAEVEEQLERLREQQQQLLQDSDEVQERMQASQNEAMQDAQQQMQQARENLQQSSQALQQGNTSQALSAGTRAEEDLKDLQEEVRQQAANQFADGMQQMKSQAAELEERQQQLTEQIQSESSEPSAGLRSQEESGELSEQIQQQREQLKELLEQMQETVTAAEDAEPLLAQKLYDSYRRTQQQQTQQRLEVTQQLLERNMKPQARQLADESSEDLSLLRSEIDEAAEAVLGSEVDSLKRALDQLEQLNQQLEGEIADATGRQPRTSAGDADDPNAASNSTQANQPPNGENQASTTSSAEAPPEASQGQGDNPGREQASTDRQEEDSDQRDQTSESQANSQQQPPSETQPQSGNSSSSSPTEGQANSQSPGQPGSEQPGTAPSNQQTPGAPSETPAQAGQSQQSMSQSSSQPGLRSGQPSSDGGNSSGENAFGWDWGGGNPRPLTGDEFRDWSDRLRDVEELVTDPELRWQATQIRQAAREIRRDVRKHSADPQWSEVEDLVAKPLRDLQRRVSDELLRRVGEKTEIVPVDRDPVPSEFDRSVREYYENLGVGL